MDWLTVFSAAGGARVFANGAKEAGQLAIEHALGDERAKKSASFIASASSKEAIRDEMWKRRLEVLGSAVDAIYPLRLLLRNTQLKSTRDSLQLELLMKQLLGAYGELVDVLGADRAYFPTDLGSAVHRLKNGIYEALERVNELEASDRAGRSPSQERLIALRDRLVALRTDSDRTFAALSEASQRMVADALDRQH